MPQVIPVPCPGAVMRLTSHFSRGHEIIPFILQFALLDFALLSAQRMFKANCESQGALPASEALSSPIPWLGIVQGFSRQRQEMGWVCMEVVVGSEFGKPLTESFWGPARLNHTSLTHYTTGA